MNSKIKTIIISVVVVSALILIYIFFLKDKINSGNLTTTFGINQAAIDDGASTTSQVLDVDFLALLLSIKNLKLNDAVFSNQAFLSLRDSSIVLQNNATEGRRNPFAPIGIDNNSTVNTNTPNTPNTAN